MVCIIRIRYRRIIGIDKLGEIAYRIIFVANDLAVGVGVGRYTVERVKGSLYRAVAVVYSQYVTVGIIGVADRFLGAYISCNAALGIIEELSMLTAGIGDLLADVQLVVLIALGGLQKTPPLFPKTEKSFLI